MQPNTVAVTPDTDERPPSSLKLNWRFDWRATSRTASTMSKRQRLLLSGHRKTAALKPTHSVATAAGRRLGRRRDSPPRCRTRPRHSAPRSPGGGGGEGSRESASAHEARAVSPGPAYARQRIRQ